VPIREIVSQISPPMRILLAGAVVFLVLWFTLLRPKSESVEPVAATPTPAVGNVDSGKPATSAAGKVVEKAKDAATTAEGAAKAAAGETADGASKPATGSATSTTTAPDARTAALPELPAATLAKLPKDVAGALEARKVLVLAVLADGATPWRPLADDDRYVRNTLKKVNRYGGDVFVKQVPLGRLYSYGPIVNDLKVNQTPSVVVVDRKLQANVIPGYLDRLSINQAIADARAASIDPLITDSYLRKANKVCANGNVAAERWSLPTIRGRKAMIASSKRLQKVIRDSIAAVRRVPAPARWAGLKRQWLKELRYEQRTIDKTFTAARRGDLVGALATLSAFDDSAARKLDHRFDAVGLTSCSVLRRS
jgi:hypothetical protein